MDDEDEVVVEEIVEEEVIAIDIAETAPGVLLDNASSGTAAKSFFVLLFLIHKNKKREGESITLREDTFSLLFLPATPPCECRPVRGL